MRTALARPEWGRPRWPGCVKHQGREDSGMPAGSGIIAGRGKIASRCMIEAGARQQARHDGGGLMKKAGRVNGPVP